MTKATLLYPKIVHIPTCGHEIINAENRRFRESQGKGFICGKKATVTIDDVFYCKTHGNMEAERILLKRDALEKYPRYIDGKTAFKILLKETGGPQE